VKRLARALDARNLTGTVSGQTLQRDRIYCLEGILSFIEHLDVRLSEPVSDESAIKNPADFFESAVVGGPRNNGGGAVLGSDAFNPWKTSRSQFIELALRHLEDAEFCQRTKFRQLFFKRIETFLQRKPFLEISYFLLFSGLESFARASQNDFTTKNASVPITKFLLSYGFDVHQDNPKHLTRSVSTYLHLRNALFHQGEFTKTVHLNDQNVTLNCSDYLYHLSMLVSLAILKSIGFDDGHTNWDCWMDRQLHR
jgi:hypothetical protein